MWGTVTCKFVRRFMTDTPTFQSVSVQFCVLPLQVHCIWHCGCCFSVAQLCLTLCDPTDCSTPGFPVLHYLLEFVQTHIYWVGDAMQPSHPLSPPLLLHLIFPSVRVFSNKWLFTSGGQSFGALALVLPMTIQSLFPLGLTGLIFLKSKGLF